MKDKKIHSVSIIIVNYHSEIPLLRCLSSIYRQIDTEYEIILVDNGSDNGGIVHKVIADKKIKYIKNPENYGFSRAVNKGITMSKYDRVLLVNPDTELQKSAIEKLNTFMSSHKASIAGAAMRKVDGGLHDTAVRKPDIWTILFDYTNLRRLVPCDYFHRHHYYLDIPNRKVPIYVDAVSGACMLIKKDIFNVIGYFDEDYFMYLEDVDFCIRAKKAGYKIVYYPKPLLVHIGGYSSNNKEKINIGAWLNSRSHYLDKHFSRIIKSLINPILKVDDMIIKILSKRV